jgi:CRP/FNR family transcriptional regulator, cyclic AMP receptor protein
LNYPFFILVEDIQTQREQVLFFIDISLKEKKMSSSSGDQIRHHSLFSGVSHPVIVALEKNSTKRKLEKGSFLFYRGDPADNFYLLISGAVEILLSSPDGRELVINEMVPGDFFGELGLLTGQPRSADAVARLPSLLLAVPRQAFLSVLEAEPILTRRLLEATAIRLSRTSDFENSLAFLDAHARLARVLLNQDDQNEELGYITISQEELATRSGLIRQTVAKTLGEWRRKGWLLTGRGHIVLLNREALRMWFHERAG